MKTKREENYKTVLLVSDNQVDIQRIEKQFMDTGSMDCRLCRCIIVPAALEQLGNKRLDIDIVVLDLRLENAGSPADIYKTVKEKSGDIPVILLTGESKEEFEQARSVLDAGAAGHTHRSQFGSLVWLISSVLFPKSKG